MEKKIYDFKKIGTNEIEIIKELFAGVFTIEPWNDDWSNQEQLKGTSNNPIRNKNKWVQKKQEPLNQ